LVKNFRAVVSYVIGTALNIWAREVLYLEEIASNHIQISSRRIPVRPWSSGKQLPLGLNLEIWATSHKLDRSQALGYYKI
tara:strand:+ start:379 stop:618 length:240 start_codon:yes stop_codon:yes gene_type:complete